MAAADFLRFQQISILVIYMTISFVALCIQLLGSHLYCIGICFCTIDLHINGTICISGRDPDRILSIIAKLKVRISPGYSSIQPSRHIIYPAGMIGTLYNFQICL